MDLVYRQNTTFEDRIKETQNVKSKYPNRIPVILESSDLKLKKNKFLIPSDLTVGGFLLHIRKYIPKNESQGIFLFIGENSKVYGSGNLFSEIVKEFGVIGKDGFLKILVRVESVFGLLFSN